MADKTYSIEELKDMAEVLGMVTKNDPASLVPTSAPMHGMWPDGSNNAGIFSTPGVRPDVFSALQRPRSVASAVGIQRSLTSNEKIMIMTGQLTETGTNASDFCGDPPEPGKLKKCVQNYIWGKLFFKTNLDVFPEMGGIVDYADVDKRVVNMATQMNPFIPDVVAGANLGSVTGQRLASELFRVGVALERSFERVLMTGNTATAPAATRWGWIREFNGLSQLITTGKTDLDSGIACPAADSTIVTFGANIATTAADGRDIVQTMTDTYRGMQYIAERTGLDGTTWAWVMTHKAFTALTQYWACNYSTARCTTGTAGQPVNRDAMAIRRLELDMYSGRYLLVDDQRVPVLISDGIVETGQGNNLFTSDVYLVPLAWMGRRLLNVQYLPMDNADIQSYQEFFPNLEYLNNGMYLVSNRNNGFCGEILFAMKARMILDAPFIAAAVNDLSYAFYDPVRSAYPDNTYDYVDGGASGFTPSYL